MSAVGKVRLSDGARVTPVAFAARRAQIVEWLGTLDARLALGDGQSGASVTPRPWLATLVARGLLWLAVHGQMLFWHVAPFHLAPQNFLSNVKKASSTAATV
jgi:hypothetical protein